MEEYKKNNLIISLDLGSTNLKVALFDDLLKEICKSSMPMEYLESNLGYVEFDGDDVWGIIQKLIKNIITTGNIKINDSITLSICGQANTFTILDKEYKTKMNFISWLDERAEDESKILMNKFKKDIRFLSGHSFIGPGSLISKILWIKRNKPDLILESDTVIPFTTYIMFKLTGSIYVDKNIAAMDGVYFIKDNDIWEELINFVEIKKNQLPDLIEVGIPIKIKKLANIIKDKAKFKFVFAGNDQTAVAVGNFLSKNLILISLGTALSVYRYRDKMGPFNKYTFWGLYPEGGYYELFANSNGMNIFDDVVRNYFPIESISELTEIAQTTVSVNRNSDIFFYPGCFNNDLWNADIGINEKALIVFEGMGFYIRHILEKYLNIKHPIEFEVYAAGGGSKNNFWLQIVSNILDTKIYKSNADALFGAAKIALGNEFEFNKNIKKIFLPEEAKAKIYDNIYKEWLIGLPLKI